MVAEQDSLSAEGGGPLMGLQNLPAAAAAAEIEGSAAGIVVGAVAVGIVEVAAEIEDSAAEIGGYYSPFVGDIGSQPPTAP